MRLAWTMAAVAMLALGVTACGNSSSGGAVTGNQKLANGKTFTGGLANDPGSLDPALTSLSDAYGLDRFLYDSLLNIDNNGKVVSGLAGKWDGTTTHASYTLRPGITCSDGAPLTASDVAANINFVADPKNQSTRLGTDVQPGAKATADDSSRTVSVTSTTPDAFLVRNVGSLQIVCAKGMKDRSMLRHGADGTGMYTLAEAVPDDHYTLKLRPGYSWGPDGFSSKQDGVPATVVSKVVTNETTAANLLLSGGLNAAAFIGPDKERLAAQKLFERDTVSPLGELFFNERNGEPGSSEVVRRALTQALDLDQVGKVITSGTGKPATGLVAPGFGPCKADTVSGNVPGHDVDAARSGLDEAGWKTGQGGTRVKDGKKLSIALIYPSAYGPPMQSGAELLRQEWKAVGVDVSIKGITNAQYGQQIVTGGGSWDATILPFGITLPTQIVPYLSGPTPPAGQNFADMHNDGYDSHVKSASEAVGAAGCPDWEAAEKSLFQHVDLVPFVDSVTPAFGKGTSFELSQGSITPSSIRMYAG